MKFPLHTLAIGAAVLAGVACSDAPLSLSGHLAVAVSPLGLSDVVDVTYSIEVHNALGESVWSRSLDAGSFGGAGGALSYIGVCDARTEFNSVTLTLVSLHDAAGVVDPSTYMNPTPLTREVACVPNGDTSVEFDLTVARQARQGFFDVAVSFDDIFCSAKLDCVDRDGGDLNLLHRTDGTRGLTAVVGFACVGSDGQAAFLYLEDLVVTCDGLATDVVVDPAGLGNVAPPLNTDEYLFGAAVYRGVEGLAGTAYWNVALGLDVDAFEAAGVCSLSALATASSSPWPMDFDGFGPPPGAVYPFIRWQVQLSDGEDGGRRTCTTHALTQDAGVDVVFAGVEAEALRPRHRFDTSALEVVTAPRAECDPPCANGYCAGQDLCACDPGWTGETCEVPICDPPCSTGMLCTAPNICSDVEPVIDSTFGATTVDLEPGTYEIIAWGGAGGPYVIPGNTANGGGGGFASGVYVHPGGSVIVWVGQGGAEGGHSSRTAFGGGNYGGTTSNSYRAGGGGGLSGVFLPVDGALGSGNLHSRALLIAGGGGGRGYQAPGAGGGASGQKAANSGNSRGGHGGTQTAGGAGGANAGGYGSSGAAGSALNGGRGGTGNRSGGGGGGGYFGGGGGGSNNYMGSGGGGGSAFAHDTLIANGVLMAGNSTSVANESHPLRGNAGSPSTTRMVDGLRRGWDGQVVITKIDN